VGRSPACETLWFMMKYILKILFLLNIGLVYSQEVANSRLSDCDASTFPELIRPRIAKREIINDTLYMSIGFAANCCIEPQPKLIKSNDTLYLIKNNISDLWCACNCCFELDLKITGIYDTNFILIVDGIELITHSSNRVKLPDEYIFDKKTPINQGNENNLKIGLWRTYYENSNKIKIEEYFSEEWKEPIRVWYKTYDKTGNLTSVGIRTSPNNSMIELEPNEYYRILKHKP
jgi:hypothetical protein